MRLQLELDQAKVQSAHDLVRLRIERGVPIPASVAPSNDGLKLTSPLKFVPHFYDSQIDFYLEAFEKAMLLHKFPRDVWTQLIHT